ncbi:MAG: hypothetical protein LBB51_01575 [Zoogloeaceae bacterium]|jgi:hypothetical protein|nr:hypothetical protein [Zoogloeaceae bacterium]
MALLLFHDAVTRRRNSAARAKTRILTVFAPKVKGITLQTHLHTRKARRKSGQRAVL